MMLEPDRLVLTDRRGRSAHVAIASDRAPPWIAAIAAARASLAEPAYRGAALAVILSESYYRLALLPADGSTLDPTELAAIAKHHFRATLGDACEFRVAAVSGADRNPLLLCCAIDSQCIRGLQQAAEEAGGTIVSIQPRIVAFAAAHAQDLAHYSGHLVIADTQTAACIALRNGAWLQAVTRRVGPASGWLPAMLEQAEQLAGTGMRSAWLDGPLDSAASPGWQLRHAKSPAVGLAAR